MRRHAIALAGLALALAGCGIGRSQAPPGDPALACQTAACSCIGQQSSIFVKPEERPPLWRPNGDAYCPEGFTLKRTEKAP